MAKHRSEAERRQEVARWRASGLSVMSYCSAHGMSAESLRRWREEADGRGAVRAPAFVRMDVVGRREGGGLVVEVGGVRIRVERGFDATLLREMVEALAGEGPG
jgi:hypothetical protein